MAYNFPVNYYPFQQYQQYQQAQQAPAPTGVIWVQGEAGAKSYLVAPNSTVYLWDSESQTIYIKSADPSGMPSIKVLEYKVKNSTPEPKNLEFATKNELDDLRKQIEALKKEVTHESNADYADALSV